jgi:hypothetical protein
MPEFMHLSSGSVIVLLNEVGYPFTFYIYLVYISTYAV